ncbi:MAG: DUF1801 domain-containing protein, partial [Pseudomonadota bacterium]|nr:DUF1801 domain-containing protein [Pseudomonadota bacterium]
MPGLDVKPALPPETARCFARAGSPVEAMLVRLRELVFEAAAETPAIGDLAESLKWGQPSYTPEKQNTGSSVRLDATPDGRVAAYFICHTNLVDRFREIYPDSLTFEGNRAILLDPEAPLPEAELKHCFAMALTYKLK